MGFYHSLKDSPCCSEWIDVRMLQVGLKKYAVGIDPLRLCSRHSKILEKADFKKHAASLASSVYSFKQSFLSILFANKEAYSFCYQVQ